MKPHGGHGEGGKQGRGETEDNGKVPRDTFTGSVLDGPVPEDQREREHQERGELQGEQGGPEQQEEACGEGPDHQRAARIVICAVLGEGQFKARDKLLRDGATVQFLAWIVEQGAWMDQYQVQEMARDKQQKESADRDVYRGRGPITRCIWGSNGY